jgi:hypothetical protein
MVIFKEINGKEIINDLFSTRDNQLETEKTVDTIKECERDTKPKKVRKPRTPKKNE